MHLLLVEDDARTRARLERALAGHERLKTIATAESCAGARARQRERPADVLLTDLGLPDGSGIELIAESARERPRAKSMVITVFGDERHVVAAIQAGAAGYLLKDASDEDIRRSIAALLDGGSPISPAVASYLLKQMRPAAPAKPAGRLIEELSEREIEVLQLVADGCSYAEIGKKLFISINTVGTHISHIYGKLQVNSRGKAVREAGELGLLKRT